MIAKMDVLRFSILNVFRTTLIFSLKALRGIIGADQDFCARSENLEL